MHDPLMPPALSVIIPACNEADRIADTVQAVRAVLPGAEIVVVDDGSTDGTGAAAKRAGATSVLVNERNLGKGRSLERGIAAAQGEVLLFLDADLGESAGGATPLLSPVLEGRADMTIAVLPAAKSKGGFGFVVRTAGWGIRRCTGFVARAPVSGQRAVRREVLAAVGGLACGYGIETALTIDALNHGFRVVEVEVPLRHRETGRNLQGFLHRGKQWRQIVRALVPRLVQSACRRRRRPVT